MGMAHMRIRRGLRRGWGACRWVGEEEVRGLGRRRRLTLIWRRMIWKKGMIRLRLLRLRCRLYLLLVWLMLGMSLLGLLEIERVADEFFAVLTWKSQRAISFKSARTM